MRNLFGKVCFVLLAGLLSVSFSSVSYGGNECKIRYGWNTGSVAQANFKNKSKTIHLDKGETKTIGKKRLNYVKNLKTRKVKFYLKNATNVTLDKGMQNPAAGTYVQSVKLKRVKCSGASSGSTSSSGSSAPSVTGDCSPAPMDVVKVPAPPAPAIPTPYPNLNATKNNCVE